MMNGKSKTRRKHRNSTSSSSSSTSSFTSSSEEDIKPHKDRIKKKARDKEKAKIGEEKLLLVEAQPRF